MSTNSIPVAVANRLANEKSPYLLQHQYNPVDWHPWGEEAFARARTENKPIFLSIGYSTCHWCHVMERESFEDPEVAEFLNRCFISIKVDREERPDVDRIYMTFVQAISGEGGWPLSVFLTPELNPFYGGTYFPPEPRHNRPGFLQLLERINELWLIRREDLTTSADQLHEQVSRLGESPDAPPVPLTADILHRAAAAFKQEYDPRFGGFGAAPKFPRPSQPAFLLRYGMRYHDEEAVRMVLHTCEQMAAGGIYDHLGGGFARYSVDERWRVPHFEKMLYDNAQLADLYLEAFLASGDSRFAGVVRETLRYVLRDMTHPEGGFFSAEDADSEGKEGKFYCWTRAELARLLTPEEYAVVVHHFGISQEGNFLDHSDPEPLRHLNVLSIVHPDLSPSDRKLLESGKHKMTLARAHRVRPGRDDKVLVSWNGLMLGALARAYGVLGEVEWRFAAEKNLRFAQTKLWDPANRTLYHRWRDGASDTVQLLHGYAFLLAGTLDLYEVTLAPRCLQFALDLAEGMLGRFYDRDRGGFWQTEPGNASLILRLKEDYDGAEPSGNSMAIFSLLRLAAITGRKDLQQKGEQSLRFFAPRLHQLPQALPVLLQALDFWLDEPRGIVIAGNPEEPATQSLLHATHGVYCPNKVVLGNQGPVDAFSLTLDLLDGQPTAYPCSGTACQAPTQDTQTLTAWLSSPLDCGP